MDVAFFLVILYSFTYQSDQVCIAPNSNNIQTGTGLVTAIDADGLQPKEHLQETTLLTLVNHTVQFYEITL